MTKRPAKRHGNPVMGTRKSAETATAAGKTIGATMTLLFVESTGAIPIALTDGYASNVSSPRLPRDSVRKTAGPRDRSNILLPPQRDIQQWPPPFRQERQDFLKIEKVCVVAEFFHFFQEVVPKLGVIPLMDRHTEALLLAIDKFVRDDSTYSLLQNVFEHPVPGLYRFWDAHGQLYEFVIEEGYARFQAHRHTHLVHAHQQQFRQSQV